MGVNDAPVEAHVGDVPGDEVGDVPGDEVGIAPGEGVGDAPGDEIGDAPGEGVGDDVVVPKHQEFDESFNGMMAVEISFNDSEMSFNNSMEIESIIEVLNHNTEDENNIQEKKYNVGQYIFVKYGVNSLPALVVDWPWVQYFSDCKKRASNVWKIDDICYTITEKDVVKTLAAPHIQMCGRCLCYTFAGKVILIPIFYFEAVSSNKSKLKRNQYDNE
ncbi:unnamed protein product [Mytilus coruscus]|uniref:Uncharacterized protein n=1 Tax=Mytilus coruscus TaxID=42192 RepID=A0A6J8DGT4_MYTCO|nr:unnamed protein product [Mytilus coruscus]